MFGEPGYSALDLNFWMFRTHVRVHPLFWLVSALFGLSYSALGWHYVFLWVVLVFLSILVHEFGHVLVGRLFGGEGHIVLYGMGGLAVGIMVPRRWQRIAVSFGGPFAQFLLLGIVLLVDWLLPMQATAHQPVAVALNALVFINLFWPLLNLRPIWPLDGGKISREVCEGISPRSGTVVALGISTLVAGALAVNALLDRFDRAIVPGFGGLWIIILFGMLALSSGFAMQEEMRRSRGSGGDDEAWPWERGGRRERWERGDSEEYSSDRDRDSWRR